MHRRAGSYGAARTVLPMFGFGGDAGALGDRRTVEGPGFDDNGRHLR
jgi:hypothetical protein